MAICKKFVFIPIKMSLKMTLRMLRIHTCDLIDKAISEINLILRSRHFLGLMLTMLDSF